MKRLLLALTACVLVLLTACQITFHTDPAEDAAAADQTESTARDAITYTVEEMRLTLPYAFTRIEARGNWSANFGTAEVVLQIQRMDKALLYNPDIGVFALAKAKQLDEASLLPTAVKLEDGLAYYDFTMQEQKKTFHYLYLFTESDAAYWMFVYYCEDELYDGYLPSFMTWTKEITFTEP